MIPKAERPLPHLPGRTFAVIALATSAGGLNALSKILSALPANFPTAIAVVQHLSPQHPSWLVHILGNRIALRVKQAEDGDRLQAGTVHIAPPDQHLLVNPNSTLSLSDAARVQYARPAANVLFESVASSFKERAIAVVLTGMGKDGATGVQVIKQGGGVVIVQNEATSEFFSMPNAAIHTGMVDFILPLDKIPTALISLVMPGAAG